MRKCILSLLMVLFYYPLNTAQTTYFIKYKNSVSKSEIESKVQSNSFLPANANFSISANVKSVSHLAKGLAKEDDVLGRIIKINFDKDVDETSFLSLKNIDPSIEYIEENKTFQMDFIPNDSLVGQQWALEKIQAFNAWNVTTGSDTVLLGIIDTGIDYLHPDLKNKIWLNPGEMGTDNQGNDKRSNGIDDDNNGFVDDYQGWDFTDRVGFPFDSSGGDYLGWDNDPKDENGHGTYIAGIAGAEVNNTSGIAGVAPDIKLVNLRAFDPGGYGEEDDVASAILYAVKMKIKVLNMSFGDYSFSYVLRDVVRYAYSHNIVLVGSSGNQSSSDPHYPSGYSEVICVGNSTMEDYVAGTSNYGSTLDLVAPGTQILTTNKNGGYSSINGTSAATPHVAATAALILSLQNFTNEEVKQIIKSTTDDIEEPGWDLRSGAGRLNTYKAVTTLAPSVIKFNSPYQDYSTFEDQLNINASVLSALFTSYSLFVGEGFNPETWTALISNSTQQISDQDIYTLDLTSLPDTVYCLRLVVNLTNGRTLEERVNFHIIRTPPKVIEIANGPLYYGDKSTIAGEFYTDQVCVMRMYYRKSGESNFNFVTLDGFNTNNQFVKQEHWGFIPKEIVQPNTLYEVYFEAENLVGLKTTILDTVNNIADYYRFMTDQPPSISTYDERLFKLPKGTLRTFPVSFLSNNNNEVLFQAFYETSDLYYGLYEYENNNFIKIDSIYNKYPKLFGDFNNNGLKDLISTSHQNIIIDEQYAVDSFDSLVTKYTDANSNNPLIADDLDSNGDYELITLTNGDKIIKWDINSNLTISNPDTLYTQADTSDIEPGFVFSNYPSTNMEVADIDNDGNKEIWFLDDDGDLKSFVVQPSGLITRGSSFITQGLITRNPNIFSIGDYDGDGIKDFAVLYQTNSIAPTFLLLVFTYRNNNFEIITQKVFLDQADEFIGFSFSEAYQSIKFADVDFDGADELIINIFPYAYILDYDSGNDKFIFYSDGVNTDGIFASDINNNGKADVGLQFSDGYKFFEFGSPIRPEIPTILNAFSNSSLQSELSWIQSADKYYIYRGNGSDNLQLYDSVLTNSYIDFNVSDLNTYYYSIQAYDQFMLEPYSKLTSPVEVYIHKPATVDSVYGSSNKSVLVHFTEKMNNTIENLQAFKLNNSTFPNSISPASQYSYLLSFNNNLSAGINQLVISNLKDLYNSPITTDTVSFEVIPELNPPQFFISSFEILNAYEIKIVFNYEVDETSATNPDNYVFTPDNKVSSVRIDGNDSKIVFLNLKGHKPIGSIGREYVLQLKNVRSSAQSGNLIINEGAGSYIVLSTYAKDLSDMYVYPNPASTSTGNGTATFANLPQRVKITIWSLNGRKIRELLEDNGDGGITFDLKDERGEYLPSGVYVYRAVMLDAQDNEGQEKLGKFAVVR